ncbi:VOC family protein [Streptomyces sp. NPDC004237]|uniref:VOC family protein n=1 Tax=Streptomyces sp. NPDC004237 TaxID=3154455 RepID=UPI0033A17A14
MAKTNTEFQLRGVNHLALVCRDMAQTVDFYSNVLGMPLTRTLELPGGTGQHFFFDMGNGDSLAFFYFPGAPEPATGLSSPGGVPGLGELNPDEMITAVASMHHVAFDISAENIETYRRKLLDKGIEVGEILNHDDSESQNSPVMHDGVYCRSLYFMDPNGILLEFAAWTREPTEADACVTPAQAATANAM